MKNLLPLFLAVVATFFSPACKKDDPGSNSVDPLTRIIRETDKYGAYDFIYDAQFRCIKIQGTDFVVDYDYAMNNTLISHIITINPGGPNDTIRRVFTLQNGYATEQFRTNQDGSTQLRLYTRDAQSRTIKESYFDGVGNLTSMTNYEYDAQGNRIKASTMAGGKTWVQVFEYDGAVVNTLLYGQTFLGPDEPFLPSKMRFLENDVEIYHINYSYETDNKGRVVRNSSETIYPANPGQNTSNVSTYEYQ